MAIIIITVLVEGPTLSPDLKGETSAFTIIDSGFFEAVGVISFAYVCHHNTLLIYGSLAMPTIDRWNQVTHISMAISVIASLVMGASGYLIFVSDANWSLNVGADLTADFPPSSFQSDRKDQRQHTQ